MVFLDEIEAMGEFSLHVFAFLGVFLGMGIIVLMTSIMVHNKRAIAVTTVLCVLMMVLIIILANIKGKQLSDKENHVSGRICYVTNTKYIINRKGKNYEKVN